jgi:hypothetical protein
MVWAPFLGAPLGAVAGSVAAAGTGLLVLNRPALAQQNEVPVEVLHKPGPLGDKILGDENAPVTIVEYASVTCGACAAFHQQTYPTLKSKYIDTGKVRLIMREFPTQPAPVAVAGFMLARCSEDRYFPMLEAIFEQFRSWLERNGDSVETVITDERTARLLPLFTRGAFGGQFWDGRIVRVGAIRASPGEHVGGDARSRRKLIELSQQPFHILPQLEPHLGLAHHPFRMLRRELTHRLVERERLSKVVELPVVTGDVQ